MGFLTNKIERVGILKSREKYEIGNVALIFHLIDSLTIKLSGFISLIFLFSLNSLRRKSCYSYYPRYKAKGMHKAELKIFIFSGDLYISREICLQDRLKV